MGYFSFPKYVSVAERREKALKALEKLKKKNKNICPVVVTGSKIANTWWGIEWNSNLSHYSDYENRIGRGRSFVRNNAVIDLQIEKGKVTAKVCGTKTYNVTILIKPISKAALHEIEQECAGKFASLQELVDGKFPKGMKTLFTAKNGLFPNPKEISLACTCPDYAVMCKHVAAALYGISVRLDHDPLLFFKLRDIDIDSFVSLTIKKKSAELLSKSANKSSRIIDQTDLGNLFGIELER